MIDKRCQTTSPPPVPRHCQYSQMPRPPPVFISWTLPSLYCSGSFIVLFNSLHKQYKIVYSTRLQYILIHVHPPRVVKIVIFNLVSPFRCVVCVQYIHIYGICLCTVWTLLYDRKTPLPPPRTHDRRHQYFQMPRPPPVFISWTRGRGWAQWRCFSINRQFNTQYTHISSCLGIKP